MPGKNFLAIATVTIATASAALAQGPVQRAGQAIDGAGKSIRRGVESAVARGQTTAQERQVLQAITQRVNNDKRLVGSTIALLVEPGGVAVLRGSVRTPLARSLAVELVDNTVGVTSVVDELAVVEEVQVIESEPSKRVIRVPAPTGKAIQSKAIVRP